MTDTSGGDELLFDATSSKTIFRQLGKFVHKNAGKLVFCITIALITLCAAIKSAKFDNNINNWIERNAKVADEQSYIESTLGEGYGTTSELLIQTPVDKNVNILDVKSLMIHLEAMAIATHVTVEMFDVTWSLKDLCYTPSLPYSEQMDGRLLENIIPCAIKTPLDCFWEGSKLLGPEPAVSVSPLGIKVKWSSLNPIKLVDSMSRLHATARYSFSSLIDWMRRVGMSTGYQYKPCLVPTDPNCPITAPNKDTKLAPDIGAQLTGGCYGFASKEMHWLEEEIVGGSKKNKSGYIIHANALQSIIQLLGERELYDYWRKDQKVSDISNWSIEKSKLVLEAWQSRFKEELVSFSQKSTSADYNIYAITSASLLSFIDVSSFSSLISVELCFALMTLFTCVAYPRFEDNISLNEISQCDTRQKSSNFANQLGIISLAIIMSAYIGLQFIASLGLSSLFDLPINAATTQILPPLSLFYGFNQLFIVGNSFSIRSHSISPKNLCSTCLNDFGPGVLLELFTYATVLLAIAIIPVPATRVFALQTISYMIISTLTSMVLFPSILTIFIQQRMTDHRVYPVKSQRNIYQTVTSKEKNPKTKLSKKVAEDSESSTDSDDQFNSQIQNDLRNLQHDCSNGNNLDFSLEGNGISMTLKVTSNDNENTHVHISTSKNSTTKTTKFDQFKSDNQSKFLSIMPEKDDSQVILPDFLAQPTFTNTTICDPSNQYEKNQNTQSTDTEIAYDAPYTKIHNASLLQNIFIINRFSRFFICILTLVSINILASYVPKVEFGLDLKDIVDKNTEKYQALSMQQNYFPIYNMFAITKGPFDYASNQRLIYEYHKRISQVSGIIVDPEAKPRFWLESFRNWLIELQERFDLERNQSLISNDGWGSQDLASDNAKLAYKLLAQTGKTENPVDTSQVATSRLVDSQGIINQKAFYYYLTAWVLEDPFSYSTSEACFKPEPKLWNDDPSQLKIEKAKPLTYAQIPFLMKLDHQDKLRTISEVRTISQTFQQLSLPNFPTGIPFIFWDQFSHLSILIGTTIALSSISIFFIISIISMSFRTSAIVIIISVYSLVVLYGSLGIIGIQFNNILGILLIFSFGINVSFLVHILMAFLAIHGNSVQRISKTFQAMSYTNLKGLVLLGIVALSFFASHFDFIVRFSQMISCMIILNAFNCLAVLPVVLSIYGIKPQANLFFNKIQPNTFTQPNAHIGVQVDDRTIVKDNSHQCKKKSYPKLYKSRQHKSRVSLSTISEESL